MWVILFEYLNIRIFVPITASKHSNPHKAFPCAVSPNFQLGYINKTDHNQTPHGMIQCDRPHNTSSASFYDSENSQINALLSFEYSDNKNHQNGDYTHDPTWYTPM